MSLITATHHQNTSTDPSVVYESYNLTMPRAAVGGLRRVRLGPTADTCCQAIRLNHAHTHTYTSSPLAWSTDGVRVGGCGRRACDVSERLQQHPRCFPPLHPTEGHCACAADSTRFHRLLAPSARRRSAWSGWSSIPHKLFFLNQSFAFPTRCSGACRYTNLWHLVGGQRAHRPPCSLW